MTKVMVFNFKTMQFEQTSKDEGNDLLSLIDAMNSDCAAQQTVAVDVANVAPCKHIFDGGLYCIHCGEALF